MNGTSRVENTPEVGTAFTLELPQTPSPQETLAKTPHEAFEFHTKEADHPHRVLCIEDNPPNLRLLEVA